MFRFGVRSSSSDEVYEVEAEEIGGKVRFTCTCAAGAMSQVCKHRMSVLDGDVSNVVGDVIGLERLRNMIRGSRLGQRLQEIESIEAQIAALKRKVASAKKALGREMAQGA